jgi:ribosomal protein S12 methylthiotransferase accessory factor YcaO
VKAGLADIAGGFAAGAFGGIAAMRAVFELARGEYVDAGITIAVGLFGGIALMLSMRKAAMAR